MKKLTTTLAVILLSINWSCKKEETQEKIVEPIGTIDFRGVTMDGEDLVLVSGSF